MVSDKDLTEEGKFDFPYKCPICKADMTPEDNIEQDVRDGRVVSILSCGNKGCKYTKILD